MQRQVFIIMLLGLMSVAAMAQGRGVHRTLYDPKTEATFTGFIDEIQSQGCMGWRNGTHLMIKTESETVEVCVGPASFVQQKGFSFAKNDKVEVIGSRVKVGGRNVVIARQVTKDNRTLTLRDSQGIPEWSGGHRRNN